MSYIIEKNIRQRLFAILFCAFLFLYFSGGIPIRINDFISTCEHRSTVVMLGGEKSFCSEGVSQTEQWIFDIIAAIGNFFTMAIIMGIFTHWFRGLRAWIYLIVGFTGRFITLLFFVPYLILHKSDFSSSNFYGFGVENIITIFLQIVTTFYGSYIGYKYVSNTNSVVIDVRDLTNFTLGGLSKKVWVALTLSFFTVFKFLLDFSIIQIYLLMESFKTKGFWLDTLFSMFNGNTDSGLVGVITKTFGLAFIWFLYFFGFSYAVEAIKNKKADWRRTKIVGILIILPLLIQVIPLIRNRTWVFF